MTTEPKRRARNRRSAKNAGTAWETATVSFLQRNGFPNAARVARSGARDKGDVTLGNAYSVVIEAKNVAQRDLAGWVAEAEVEAVNAGAEVGVVWAKRAGKSDPGESYVILKGSAFVKLLRLGDTTH
jgi:Holliday junction resolvase